MSLPAGTTVINGFAVSPDGALYVTPTGTAAITGGTGVPIKQISGGLPIVKPPTGNMGNNGAWTSGTAFGRTITACYMWFTANQIAAGVAAGLYYAEASSTTVFTVYNVLYTGGIATVPAVKTPFVTTGPGATTGDTTAVTATQATIAANAMGATGGISAEVIVSANTTAGLKTAGFKFGATGYYSAPVNAVGMAQATIFVANQGLTNVQAGSVTAVASVANSLGVPIGSTDTTASAVAAFTLQTSGAATDWMILEVGSIYLRA